MLDERLVAYMLTELPDQPARVLEIGAGDGALADHLRASGYDVIAIDPASQTPYVQPVRLLELEEPAASFDAALAVLSLHHVEPLEESCRHLASLVRPGGRLVIDEFDIARLDVTEARWWLSQEPDIHSKDVDPEAMVAEMRAHLHPLSKIVAALEPWFELDDAEWGPYLYRWGLTPEHRPEEEREIAAGRIHATGARVTGRRNSLRLHESV